MRIYEPGSRGWKLKRFVTSTTQVPPIPGIYVLSKLHTAEGLPTSWNHVYIGQSKDLRRRLRLRHIARRGMLLASFVTDH